MKSNKLRFQKIPKYCGQTFHVFSIIFNNAKLAKQFLNYLKNKNITAKQHYTCLSRSKFIRKSLKLKFSCPISINTASTLIRLPLYPELNKHQTQHIIKSIKNFKFR